VKILLTAWALVYWSGIPLFTLDLARALKAAGDDVAVYTKRPGAVAAAIAAAGVPVVTRLDRLPFRPDIIHGQDQPLLVDALRRLPGVPAVGVTHDATSIIDAPFCHPRIVRYVAIDERCRRRVSATPGIPPERIAVILNAVDLERFHLRPPLPEKPARALIFSNYARASSHMRPVMDACADAGLTVDVVGIGVRRQVAAPEEILGRYDIVFAKARCALEAMATGTAVALCDFSGLGPMVTSANVAALRRMNFGAGVLTEPLAPKAIAAEIDKFDANDAARVAQHVRGNADLKLAAGEWRSLYRACAGETACERPADAATLDVLGEKWRSFHRLMPLVALAQRAQAIPVVGGLLHTAASRVWHARY
jgi:glycosyltransferase involved in cell wall biosynthesis